MTAALTHLPKRLMAAALLALALGAGAETALTRIGAESTPPAKVPPSPSPKMQRRVEK